MLINYYEGHKTNPIWKFKIKTFNGENYVDFYSPDLTYGELTNAGLKAYQTKNYQNAEIQFKNVLTVFGENSTDVNNLAITLIKQDKLNEAEQLLLNFIKKNKTADSFYNLSLIYRNRNNVTKELEYLIESNNLEPSKFKLERIVKLKEKNSR